MYMHGMQKSGRRLSIAAACFLWMVFPVGGQTLSGGGASPYAQKLRSGGTLYRRARRRGAIRELAIARYEALSAQELSLAELAVSGFNAALRAIDLREKIGGENLTDENLAAMELALALLKAQYNYHYETR